MLQFLTVFVFQEHWTSTTLDVSIHHDTNSLPESLRFLHRVGCQQDGSTFTVLLQHVPRNLSRLWVQTCRWLIENYYLEKICSADPLYILFGYQKYLSTQMYLLEVRYIGNLRQETKILILFCVGSLFLKLLLCLPPATCRMQRVSLVSAEIY